MIRAIEFLKPRRWLPLATAICLLAAGGCSTPKEKEARFLSRGKELAKSKDYASAGLEFRNAIQVMPRDAEPYFQLALLYEAQNDFKGAYALLRKAVDLDPKHTDAQLEMASILAMGPGKEFAEAAQEKIDSVLSSSPENPAALDLKAVAELRYGRLASALPLLEKAAENAPKSVVIAWNLAMVKRAGRDYAGGEAVLKKLVADSPGSVDAVLALARYYVTLARKEDAQAQALRAHQMNPKNPYPLLLVATLQIESGRQDLAEQSYRDLSALPNKEFKPVYALFLYRQGKVSQAISELEKLNKQDPSNRDWRGLLVSAYFTQGQFAQAEKLLAGAIKQNPNDTEALMQRAEVYTRSRNYQQAEQDLNAVLHFVPNSATAHYGLGKVYGLQGSELKYREQLNQAIQMDPNFLQARVDLSRSLLRENRSRAASDLLEKAPAAQKKTTAYLAALNWVLIALDDKKEVRKNLDVALASVRSPELLYQDALLRMSQKDYEGGRKTVAEILKDNPESTPALNLTVRSYAAEGNTAKGVQVLRDYSAAHPKSAPVLTLTGIWLSRTGNRADARTAFTNARNADPNYDLPAVALAEMDYTDGNLDGARRNITPVLARQPGDVQARILLAMTEEKSGNRAAAVENYKAAIDKDPKNQEALNDLAYLLSKDSPDEALKYAQSAVEISPASPSAQDTLGWIYYRKGVYPSAVTHLKQAVETETNPVRQYHLGLAYAKVGQTALSKQHIDAALKKDPSLAKMVEK